MTLHVFNASHDEALAAGYPFYYPSTVARRLEEEWAALPALWAASGDAVWLPDAAAPDLLPPRGGAAWCEGVRPVRRSGMDAAFWQTVTRIEPWGWDLLVRQRLRRAGAPEHLLPSDARLEVLARLSSRETTARVLPLLREELERAGVPTVGQSVVVRSGEEAARRLAEWGGAMVKGLWSCSGRGVFRMAETPTASDAGRLARLLREQGAVEMEPVQPRLLDFALEFEALPGQPSRCLGASLFGTNASGSYAGNCVGSQTLLQGRIAEALGGRPRLDAAVEACRRVLPQVLEGRYEGPFGVDMLVAATPAGPALLPCVEINLRRTMGHVALKVAQLSLKPEALPVWLKKLCYFCE